MSFCLTNSQNLPEFDSNSLNLTEMYFKLFFPAHYIQHFEPSASNIGKEKQLRKEAVSTGFPSVARYITDNKKFSIPNL